MELFNSMFVSMPIADVSAAFWDSTMPGKLIVLALFVGSAVAWTIMWTKGTHLSAAMRGTTSFLEAFRAESMPTTLFTRRETYAETPLDTIYGAGCRALGGELQAHGIDADDLLMGNMTSDTHRRLSSHQLESLRSTVDRHVADEALRLEDQMGVLATAVSAAPFLGLLGTVWGVMDAFAGMAESGSAALSAVAPGISGALLTTIVGLIVAIPSMVGYNLLSSKIRYISVQMDNFAQEFISEVQNIYVLEG